MPWLVDNTWLEQNLEDPELLIVDPRPTIKYLQGHIPRSLSLPVSNLFTSSLQLKSIGQIAGVLGNLGATRDRPILVYDAYDGQNAAMLAWVLELLGHQQVLVLSSFFEAWLSESRPILYRPLNTEPRKFDVQPNLGIRATFGEVEAANQLKILDLRSKEEFEGLQKLPNSDEKPSISHLQSAINLPWTSVLGSSNSLFRPADDLKEVFSKKGLSNDDLIITYCSFGPRAAIGYLALKHAGYETVKVYDDASNHLAGKSRASTDNCVASTWGLEQ